jgi:hypothetical protein
VDAGTERGGRGGTQPGWVGLSFTERIREEQLDRIALVKAVAASIGVEVAPHFKLIELVFRYRNRPPKEAVVAALPMPGNRPADLVLAGRHVAAPCGL